MAEKSPEKAAKAAQDEVQEKFDEESEKGFRGVEVDPTPNENYTVQGQIKGAPTPETDPKMAEKARARATELASGAAE